MMWVVFIKIRMHKWGVVLQFAIAIKKKKKNVNDNDENWKYPRTKQMGMEKTRAQLMRAENRRISEWTVEYRFK